MTQFVSQPQRVEAVQWTGENGPLLLSTFGDKVTIQHSDDHVYVCNLLAGMGVAKMWVLVPIGSWLVYQPNDLSDIWPVDDVYFQVKYEVDGG